MINIVMLLVKNYDDEEAKKQFPEFITKLCEYDSDLQINQLIKIKNDLCLRLSPENQELKLSLEEYSVLLTYFLQDFIRCN